MSSLLQAAADGFRQTYGRPALGVWSAPGRVNLIGEHTDYNGGLALPIGIDRRTWVALAPRSDRSVVVASAAEPGVVAADLAGDARSASGWSAYLLGTAWSLLDLAGERGDLPGFEAYVVSDVPIGAGLSSSAALECSLAVALDEVWGLGLPTASLVEAACRAENEVVGARTGSLDQRASLMAEQDSALLLDFRETSAEPVRLGFGAAGLSLLVIDTQVAHAHAGGGYGSRRDACERAARELGVASLREVDSSPDALRSALPAELFRRVRHVLTENERVVATVAALREDRHADAGAQMSASHASLRDDFEVSTPELDAAVALCLEGGALGARMTGGGFGGSAIALVPRGLLTVIEDAIRNGFRERGFREPSLFTVGAAAGARRET